MLGQGKRRDATEVGYELEVCHQRAAAPRDIKMDASSSAASSADGASSSADGGRTSPRMRGGGATPPASPASPEAVATELQVAAEIQRLLRATRKRKLAIVERDTLESLEVATLSSEQTSWERDAAPSPSSWNRREADSDDDEAEMPDLSEFQSSQQPQEERLPDIEECLTQDSLPPPPQLLQHQRRGS